MHHLLVMSSKYFHSSSQYISWSSLQCLHLVICFDQLNMSEKYMLPLARHFKIMYCFLSVVATGNVPENSYSSTSVFQSGFPRVTKCLVEFSEDLQRRGRERQTAEFGEISGHLLLQIASPC